MNVADFIIKFLNDKGANTVFMITGGQAMFLNDAIYRNKKIKPIFTHHEQAAAMAAEAYGRITGDIGVAMVTAGPGSINALNGVVGAWVDSSPMIVISGQSALSNVLHMEKTKIRQYGLQGIYIKPLVESITKYFVTIDDPIKTLYYMEKAYFLATTDRCGPVWIEVPLDIQRMEVPSKLLEKFEIPKGKNNEIIIKEGVSKTLDLLYRSKRPLLLVGQGVRIAKADNLFEQVMKKTRMPIITTRLGIDLIESKNKLYVGRPGLYGDRAANLAVQNADIIITVGARLDTGIIGYDAKDWGRNAKKIMVEIDPKELDKPGIDTFLKINGNVKDFFQEFLFKLKLQKLPNFSKWIKICNDWRKRYPMVLSQYKNEKPINSYYFTDTLSEQAAKDDMILVDTSSPFHVVCQTWRIKKGQRLLTTGGISTMGYWAASIGVCLANKKKRTIVITGDGCLQMNIQELATIKQNNLPIKIFIFNNNGYLLIRHTQKTHMNGRLMGESPKTGLWLPDALDIAHAYEIKGIRINSVDELEKKIGDVLHFDGPVICDVMTPSWQPIIPRIASDKKPDGTLVSKPYEDMFPFLDPKELAQNMIVKTEPLK